MYDCTFAIASLCSHTLSVPVCECRMQIARFFVVVTMYADGLWILLWKWWRWLRNVSAEWQLSGGWWKAHLPTSHQSWGRNFFLEVQENIAGVGKGGCISYLFCLQVAHMMMIVMILMVMEIRETVKYYFMNLVCKGNNPPPSCSGLFFGKKIVTMI